jgi:ribonucleoside-diphosphate reductase alpha chain
MVTTRAALRATTADAGGKGLSFGRFFTSEDVHPYDAIEWELRDAVIKDWREPDKVTFEQRGVEFPAVW